MSGVVDGRYVWTDVDDINAAALSVAQTVNDGKWSEDQQTAIGAMLLSYSVVNHYIQQDMAELLDNTRVRYAEGKSLDLRAEGFGISREPAQPASGTQQFTLSETHTEDVLIPSGFVVATSPPDALFFTTTESATIAAGETSVQVQIECTTPGTVGNVGPDTITQIESVEPDTGDATLTTTNPNSMTGGRPQESDDELRTRVMRGGNENAQATFKGVVGAIERLEKTKAVQLLVNDTPNQNGRGYDLPAWHMELVVSYDGPTQDIIDRMANYVAAGAPMTSGVNGTSITGTYTHDNGQEVTWEYSAPAEIPLYIDASFSTTSDYAGDDAVKNAIVEYVGGIKTDGSYVTDGLGMGEEVLVGDIEAAMRAVPGVYDVTLLEAGISSSPTETEVVAIDPTEIAQVDARETQGYIDFTVS